MKFWVSLLTFLLSAAAVACWAPISDEESVKRSPLIIVGHIERIIEAKPRRNERLDDVALLRVTEVLKNTTDNAKIKPGSALRLHMPSKNNRSRLSTDIYHARGSRGIWLLGYDKQTQRVGANHPTGLWNVAHKPKIERIIAGRPAPTPIPTPEVRIIRGTQ